jgi:hypothetical protein
MSSDFAIRLPEARGLSQDQEYCILTLHGQDHIVRLHDYRSIYEIPGLYERLFHDLLSCTSPQIVVQLLLDALQAAGERPADQRVLDLGAGNGLVGGGLRSAGFQFIHGLDLHREAQIAAERDRPGTYDRYLVADPRALPDSIGDELRSAEFTCLTCVAALGFGDISVSGFSNILELLPARSWVALSIKEDFLRSRSNELGRFFHRLAAGREFRIHRTHRYPHRLATDGRPLYYVCLIALYDKTE